jgi:hypothetical protein
MTTLMLHPRTTINHEGIRRWTERRQGLPATVKNPAASEPVSLRIHFPGYNGPETLEVISWDDFFQKFDANQLAFLYLDKTDDGKTSRFCQFVARPAQV